MRGMGLGLVALVLAGGMSFPTAARAGEASDAEPVSEAEKAELLAAETPQQKALRAELAALAKAGQKIYCNSNFEGPQAIYAVGADGSGFARVTPKDWPDNQEYPHVSPDGKTIAFSTKRKMSKEELLKLPCDPDYSPAEWRKGGGRLKGSTTWIMNVDGTEPKLIVMGGAPHWSRDGKYLSYCTDVRPNNRRFGLYDVGNRTEHVFDVGKQPGTTCLSADGKYYVFGSFYVEVAEILGGADKPGKHPHGGRGCNQEVAPDNKWIVHVLDYKDGSWLYRFPFEPGKKNKTSALDLGWPRASQNYFPEVSPDCKYLVYGHWETASCGKDRYTTNAADLYVTRWPPDKVNVRITWHGGTTQNPQWIAPPEAKKKAGAP